jgi:hypothetical protein
VQRVVEGAGAVQGRDRLRDARQLRRLGLEAEAPRELRRERLRLAADHDGQPPRDERGGDLLEVLPAGRRPLAARRRLVAEDRGVQALEQRARLDAELLHEHGAARAVDLERLGLAARAVEREHQLAAKPLPQRMLPDERLELADELGVPAERELRLGVLLDEREPELLEPRDLRLRERLVRELGERLAAPGRERLREQPRPPRGVAHSRFVDELPHAREVELPRADVDEVAGRARLDRLLAERLAELGDEVLERGDRGRRRLSAPERVDESVGRDDAARVEEEEREERALLRPAEREHAVAVDRFERTEDAELDHGHVVTAP